METEFAALLGKLSSDSFAFSKTRHQRIGTHLVSVPWDHLAPYHVYSLCLENDMIISK